ncbi:hypothetical protein [Pyruvatibacter mobilis]|uniref:hypothetical protein n=1 Tax=Pyruvatibacter mobilis TaxID=1712261 RepID=UPI003BABB399
MASSNLPPDFPEVDEFDLRFAALEYAMAMLVSQFDHQAAEWNDKLPGICEAASLDFGARMRRAGVAVGADEQKTLSSLMQGFLTLR